MAKKNANMSIKTVDIQTVKLARSLASKTGNLASEKANFARKFVEETRSRTRGHYSGVKEMQHAG